MGINEREHHIKALENLLSHYKAREKCEGYYDGTLRDNIEALQYAISSLKTDEAYQIMYEGEEVYTKADVVAMLEELKTEIEEIEMGNNVPFGFEPVNKFYEGVSASSKVIQQKINALRGNEND